jgi:hypothetical protein
MHSFQQLIFLTTLSATLVFSVPTPTETLQKRSFTHVVRRRPHGNHPKAGVNAMAQAYRKYGFDMPPAVASGASTVKAVTGSEAGTVAASPAPNAAEYLSPVIIGGQTLTMDFDTGSSDL